LGQVLHYDIFLIFGSIIRQEILLILQTRGQVDAPCIGSCTAHSLTPLILHGSVLIKHLYRLSYSVTLFANRWGLGMANIFKHSFEVPAEVIDANGHVNNVAYVQWMQDVAMMHSEALGGTAELYAELGTSWVIRSHFVEYKRPAFAGELIEAFTWVASVKKARSQRKYKFVRQSDGAVLAVAATDWVYVDAKTGRPKVIDEQMSSRFEVVAESEEP
jgi:acyl-CoA thioester hydrolase